MFQNFSANYFMMHIGLLLSACISILHYKSRTIIASLQKKKLEALINSWIVLIIIPFIHWKKHYSKKKTLIWSNPINYTGNVYNSWTLIDSSFILNKSSDNLFEMTSNKQCRVLFTYFFFRFPIIFTYCWNKIVTMGRFFMCSLFFC